MNENTYMILRLLFTGLKDKNGKEIYEGDIIKSIWCSKKEAKDEWDKIENYTGSLCPKHLDETLKYNKLERENLFKLR